jgi:hypothetical protein
MAPESTNTPQIPEYRYLPLASGHDANEIRLVKLLPDHFDADIQLHLVTEILHRGLARRDTTSRLSLAQLRSTLPEGYNVHETLEGRYLFERIPDAGSAQPATTSWDHPDQSLDRALYGQRSLGVIPSKLNFEALSYEWGDVEGHQSVVYVVPDRSADHVGPETTTALLINERLASALRYLRLSTVARSLWIDQLCIDQSNPIEKGHQVLLMADVYRLATRVVVWLGHDGDHAREAVKELSYLGKQVEITPYTVISAPECDEPTWQNAEIDIPLTQMAYEAIETFLQSDYFNRVWVYQEVKLANLESVFKFGTAELSLVAFRKALVCLYHRQKPRSANLRMLASKCLRVLWPGEPNLYERNLLDLVASKCFDPRDKIYGTLALAPKSISGRIYPNYQLPTEQVYLEHFLAYTEGRKRLDLLLQCSLHTRKINGPTWVPDWSVQRAWTPFEADNVCLASGLSQAAIVFQSSSSLIVKGVMCGTIDSGDLTPLSSTGDCVQAFGKWRLRESGHDQYITGESSLQAFAALLCLNRTQARYPGRSINPTLAQWVEDWRRLLKGSGSGNDILLNRTFVTVLERITERCFFITDTSLIGLGPPGMRPDDKLFVLLGCSAPIVLRPASRSASSQTSAHQSQMQYRVVGKAWVHGLMDGEALLGPLPPTTTIQMLQADSSHGFYEAHFYDTTLDTSSQEDPRLGDLPPGWQKVEAESVNEPLRTENDPYFFTRFRNAEKHITINADPRMLPEELQNRGVALQDVHLI